MRKLLLTFLFLFLNTQSVYAAIALDAVASGSAGATVTYSTTSPNEIILVYLVAGSGSGCTNTTVSDSSGLSWTLRKTGSVIPIVCYLYAISNGIQTNDVVTPNNSQATNARTIVFSFSGVATSSPFDSSVSFPSDSLVNSNTSNSTTVSTNNANDVIFSMIRTNNTFGTLTIPSGFTTISTSGSPSESTDYKIFSSTQSGLAVTYSYTNTVNTEVFVDAVTAAQPNCANCNDNPIFEGFP